MEKMGVPTAVISTEPFVSSSRAMAVSHGMPDYAFAVIPHPIAATAVDILHQWADGVLDQVISIWLNGEIAAGKDYS